MTKIIDLLSLFIIQKIFKIFNKELMVNMKLILKFYFDEPKIVNKIITNLKNLSNVLVNNELDIICDNFDFVELYNFHYRNLSNKTLDKNIKTIIYNLLKYKVTKNPDYDIIS